MISIALEKQLVKPKKGSPLAHFSDLVLPDILIERSAGREEGR